MTYSDFDLIKDSVDIVEVYNKLVEPGRHANKNTKAISCPLPGHDDEDPSASLDSKKGLWYSHKCDAGGSVIDLVMEVKGINLTEAIFWISEEYNLKLKNMSKEEWKKIQEEYSERNKIYDAMKRYAIKLHENLTDDHRKHLNKRGLTDEKIDELKIGFETSATPFCEETAKKIGAVNVQGKYYLKEKYMIPIWENNKIIYWVGYSAGFDGSIYLNPVKSEYIKKPLWGVEDIIPNKPVYLVEGVFDKLSFVEAGVPAVCLFGTNLSKTRRARLKKLKNIKKAQIKIMLDNDEAGRGKGEELAEDFWPQNKAEILKYDGINADDPNELFMVCENKNKFKETLDDLTSQNLLEYRFKKFQSEEDLEKKKGKANKIYPLLVDLDQMSVDMDVERLYEGFNKKIRKSTMRETIKKEEQKQKKLGPEKFFNNGKTRGFNASELGGCLLQKSKYIYVGEKFYRYEGGTYCPDGENYIEKKIQKYLGAHWKGTYCRDTKLWIKQKTRIDPDDLDSDIELINIKNGILNLKTGEINEHRSQYKTLVQHPVEYNPNAKCNEVDNFVREVVTEEFEELVWEFLGYCLVRPMELKKALILTGSGDNGKTALINIIFKNILGSNYISNESLQNLSENRFSSSELFGKVANINADLEAKQVQETGLFKQLTGGDQIRAERKNQDAFNFVNTARLIFAANELPVIRDYNEAFFNRLLIIPCPNSFKGPNADPLIEKKLSTPEAKSHILNKGIEGARRLLKNHQFDVPSGVLKEIANYQAKADSVTAFIKEKVISDHSKDAGVRKNEMYRVYRDWCDESGLHPVSKMKFGRRAKSAPNNLAEFYPQAKTIADNKKADVNKQVTTWKNVSIIY